MLESGVTALELLRKPLEGLRTDPRIDGRADSLIALQASEHGLAKFGFTKLGQPGFVVGRLWGQDAASEWDLRGNFDACFKLISCDRPMHDLI